MSKYRTQNHDKIAEWLKALSNPNRLEIFLRLLGGCESDLLVCSEERMCSCVGELGQELDIGPSTVSHHIKELRQAGLINVQRRGQKIVCWPDRNSLDELAGFFCGLSPASEAPVGVPGASEPQSKGKKDE